MQMPLSPNTLNGGEYPACAAMTTGHIFQVKNQATVMFLQKVLRTGHLVTLEVSHNSGRQERQALVYAPVVALITSFLFSSVPGTIDAYLLATILVLLLSRLLSIASLRARSTPSRHNALEPSVQGDLLILLAEDGWIRLRGAVNDLKAVTSCGWLSQRPHHPQLVDAMDWTARLLVYIAVVVLANASDHGKVVLMVSILLGHGSLALANVRAKKLVMNERTINISKLPGSVKKYSCQLKMVEELVKEMGRSDFAVGLGIINPGQVKTDIDRQELGESEDEVVTT